MLFRSVSNYMTKYKILIAEDEIALLEALEEKLKKAGFETFSVTNGEDATKELERKNFDFMVLDLVMPHKDGYDVLHDMRELGIELPVAVLSNLSDRGDLEEAESRYPVAYFPKAKTEMSEIVSYIKQVLENRESLD